MRGRWVRQIWHYDPTLYSPPRYRRACEYEAYVPERLADETFSVDARLAGLLTEAETAVHELNAFARPALGPLARLLLRTESIASSKVEGMHMGTRELARAEARAETGGKAGATALDILGNIDAMELAIRNAAQAGSFTLDGVLAIHRKLMEAGPNPDIAGRIRRTQNWVGGNDYNPCGADFVPPPPEYVPELLVDLCKLINDDSLPALMSAALVHAQFETIHPFDDGNGRTGRALIHVVLRRRGLARAYVPPISVILAAQREQYIAGLTRYREGDLDQWLEQFAVATARAAHLAAAYIGAVARLMQKWRDRLARGAAPRADAAAWAIIEVLPAHPVISAPVATAATGRAKSAVHQAIADLEHAGVLQPLSESKRNRSWEAAGLLDLISDLERGDLPTA